MWLCAAGCMPSSAAHAPLVVPRLTPLPPTPTPPLVPLPAGQFVDLYYSSPVMIERLSILQVSSPGVLEVLLLPWPAVDFLNFTANTTAPLSLFSQAADNTICEEWLDLLVPANMSGIDVNVSRAGPSARVHVHVGLLPCLGWPMLSNGGAHVRCVCSRVLTCACA